MSRFRPIDRATDFLLPPSIQEWLPEAHLARYVVEVVEQLALSAMERTYAGRGYDAYPPAMLLSLLIYGYATGTFSSRQIERATYDSLAFRYRVNRKFWLDENPRQGSCRTGGTSCVQPHEASSVRWTTSRPAALGNGACRVPCSAAHSHHNFFHTLSRSTPRRYRAYHTTPRRWQDIALLPLFYFHRTVPLAI